MDLTLENKLDDAIHNLADVYLGTEAKSNYIYHFKQTRISINHESESYKFVIRLYKAAEYWPPHFDPKIEICKYHINLRIGNYIHLMIGWYLCSGCS